MSRRALPDARRAGFSARLVGGEDDVRSPTLARRSRPSSGDDILAHMMAAEIDELLRRLDAAVEQLKTWEFAREALN